MKKTLKWMGIGVGALVVVLVAGLSLFGGAIVKNAVNGVGPMVMGVPVTLEKAAFQPLSGKIRLTGLIVGNPEGFKTRSLFSLGDVDIVLDVRSLFKDTIVIRRIAVLAPHITYERGLLESNFSALQKQLEGDSKKSSSTPESKKENPGRKLIIEELIITDPALNVSLTVAGGAAIPIKLGNVELKDVGKEGGGVKVSDAIKIIFSVITCNIENAVAGAGDLLGSSVKAIGSGAKAVGGTVIGGASSLVKGVGGMFGSGSPEETEVDTPESPGSGQAVGDE